MGERIMTARSMSGATHCDTRPQIEMQLPTTDRLAVPSKGLKRDGFCEDIGSIFCGRNMLDLQFIRELGAKPMVLDSERF